MIVIKADKRGWSFTDSLQQVYNSEPYSGVQEDSVAGVVTLSDEEQGRLGEIVSEHTHLAQKQDPNFKRVEHHIKKGSNKPIRSPKVTQDTEHCMPGSGSDAENIIEPSKSVWSSPVVMVKKDDGTYRICVDIRKVNSISKKDAYALPNMTTKLDQLRLAKILAKTDLRLAYHQIPIN